MHFGREHPAKVHGRSAELDWIRASPPDLGNLPGGGVSERPKERASKAREVKASESSNLSATASVRRADAGQRSSR